MHKYLFTDGLIFLDGSLWKPDQVKVWMNPVPINYFKSHIPSSQLADPDVVEKLHGPLYLPELLGENRVELTATQREQFPLIGDFEVNLTNITHKDDKKTYQACFFSQSRGFLSDVTYSSEVYTVAHLCKDDFQVPCGSFEIPYFDCDQCFAILIAEYEGYVYILREEWENVRMEGYGNWFKVERERYFSQWEEAIHACRNYCQKHP